jgi:hypothetical protein
LIPQILFADFDSKTGARHLKVSDTSLSAAGNYTEFFNCAPSLPDA